MKYYVIATKWNDEKKKQVKFIAGEFTDYNMAYLFKEAYNDFYHTDAKIYSEEYLTQNIM